MRIIWLNKKHLRHWKEALTARGFSSHLLWDWLKSEGVWRRRDFASTGSLLTPARTGAFLPISESPGSWFSMSRSERWGTDGCLEGFGCAGILLCSFFILWKKKQFQNNKCNQSYLTFGTNTKTDICCLTLRIINMFLLLFFGFKHKKPKFSNDKCLNTSRCTLNFENTV